MTEQPAIIEPVYYARDIRVGDIIGIKGDGGARTCGTRGARCMRGFAMEVIQVIHLRPGVVVDGILVTTKGRRRKGEPRRTVFIEGPSEGPGRQWSMGVRSGSPTE